MIYFKNEDLFGIHIYMCKQVVSSTDVVHIWTNCQCLNNLIVPSNIICVQISINLKADNFKMCAN